MSRHNLGLTKKEGPEICWEVLCILQMNQIVKILLGNSVEVYNYGMFGKPLECTFKSVHTFQETKHRC